MRFSSGFLFRIVCAAHILLGLTACEKQQVEKTEPDLPEIVHFNEHIRPIFAQNCSACHGGVKKSGGLSYVFRDEAIAIGDSGRPSIVPGDAAASYLMEKVTSADPKVRMPPPEHGPALKDEQIALLRKWIDQGAEWQEHWAFSPVQSVEVPALPEEWGNGAIDAFVHRRLVEEGLSPNPEAGRGPLLRRLSLDLTGVPPTEAELEHFVQNKAPDAYEQEVDRLLASPRYGERWATMWLDLARYADSKGAGQDAPRTIYKYRDWLIRAFNDDMPFDDFTIKQIAGDLLERPTYDDFIATAFHRNTHNEDEGGTDDEEFRVIAKMDRVNTTWQVWHGTTFACVQCHSHPYDPFRHEEYFKFTAFFNNTQDADTGAEHPLLEFPVDEAEQVKFGDLLGRKHALIEANWQLSHELSLATDWQWLEGLRVSTDKDAQLRYTVHERDGREEYLFEGTPTRNTMTVLANAPETADLVQALRVDVLPFELDNAAFQPSTGFLLQELAVSKVSADGRTETKLPFDRVYLDEPHPFLSGDPQKGQSGFAAYTRIFRPRHAVFRFAEPFSLAEGDQIKFVIKHGRMGGGKVLLLRRGSFALTTDESWRSLESSETWIANSKELEELKGRIDNVPTVKIPIMRERPAHLSRGSKVFIRGNWTELGEEVFPGTPASLHPLPDSDEPARLRMARWLVDPGNPLAARVLVTRFWEQLFGVGIVETLEDFGSIGEVPSHPELLDYLAKQLMHECDWSMKSLLREIVLSATYRQDNKATPELIELDPKNRLLARGPRHRMTGEMIRDQVLALAGLLNNEMYGPPVRPPLPEGGWTPAHDVAGDWVADTDDRIYRRSIYIHWQRSSPYPLFTAFDAPMRDLCTDRRVRSNTPVQPLYTLNDPALFEATQRFSQRMQSHGEDLAGNIAYGYQLATASVIPEETLSQLKGLYADVLRLYPEEEAEIRARHEAKVEKQLAAEREELKKKRDRLERKAKRENKEAPANLPDPDSVKRGPEHDFAYTAEIAAYDAVASVMLNLDEVLNK